MIEIKPATKELIYQWYDGPPAYSMRGYVIAEGGELIALTGVFICEGKKYIFSEVKEEIFKHKRMIILAARKVMKDVEGQTVYAVATEGVETAPRFIEHYGFERVAPGANVYRRN